MDLTPLVLSSMNALATMIGLVMFVTGPVAFAVEVMARVRTRG